MFTIHHDQVRLVQLLGCQVVPVSHIPRHIRFIPIVHATVLMLPAPQLLHVGRRQTV